jgi:hypothetical protein
MIPVQQQLLEDNSPQEEETPVVRIALYPLQAKAFTKLLSDARDRTGIAGILCTVNQALDLNDGRLLLELQAARLGSAVTRRIQQLIAESRKEPK